MTYDLDDCINVFIYDHNPTKEFYAISEKYMNDLFKKLNKHNELSAKEYAFLILCFGDKIQDWSRMCDEGSGGDGDVDINSDFAEFEGRFVNKTVRIIDPIMHNYQIDNINKLSKCFLETVRVYREARNWMIKKGYRI